ncbi:RNA ligase family protein [Parafrankia sp. EUN1f]|uniref:RNA ligase family protein n=1 Tax=Parafrankia sp. EUN1f TaxID=102897 RepID=UPI0001C459A5|nr:RNA ligase family protein [Parafrankia sp. EUN1f]EFC86492.1 conserved hypothetical protein [Parafrankia sp. EUN1f]
MSSGPDSFPAWPKTPRLFREMVITEKIDGTNALVSICAMGASEPEDEGRTHWETVTNSAFTSRDGVLWEVRAGSRKRWITPENDNYGFAAWALANAFELSKLGSGNHYGEWWGKGIQRGYGLDERRFSLFNVGRWSGETLPACVGLVPVLDSGGTFDTGVIDDALWDLESTGSRAVPGYNRPEGIIVYHAASHHLFKVLIENDSQPKVIRQIA